MAATTENNTNDAFAGYIKDIWIEVPDYTFQHNPMEDPKDPKWVGRDDIGDKFKSYLKDGDSGAYLITGYRGMGKTSFVRRAINQYIEEAVTDSRTVRPITISFGQKDIKELDVLRQLIKGMMDKILVHPLILFLHQKVFSFSKLALWAGAVFVMLILSDGAPFTFPKNVENKNAQYELLPHGSRTPVNHIEFGIQPIRQPDAFLRDNLFAWEMLGLDLKSFELVPIADLHTTENTPGQTLSKSQQNPMNLVFKWDDHERLWKKLLSPHGLEISGALLLISVMIAFVLLSYFIFIFQNSFTSIRYYDRLADLYDRCRSFITKEDGGGAASEKMPLGLVDKMVKKFPLANPKEMENEIIEILEQYNGEKVRSTQTFPLILKLLPRCMLVTSAAAIPVWIIMRFGLWHGLINILSAPAVVTYVLPVCSVLALLALIVISVWLYKKFKAEQKWHISFLIELIIYSGSSFALAAYLVTDDFNQLLNVPYLLPMIAIIVVAMIVFFVSSSIVPQLPLFYHRKLIFVFDEIDKIDPSPDREYFYEELDRFEKSYNRSNVNDLRERRRMVINILANLKYLITTAKAKFVFIAGREMFDAALADIADRQSAVSSIFHQVINVDSFLKDQNKPNGSSPKDRKTLGLTTLVEEYLEKILLPKTEPVSSESFVKRYYNFLKNNSDIPDHACRKVIYTLQSMIVYLTYRSNGSPKKLVRLIEEMIKPTSEFDNDKDRPKKDNGPVLYEKQKSIVLYFVPGKPTKGKGHNRKKYFIHIGYHNQYRFGFINYIFRPFLSSHGNYYKTYSDKILVSTPYLMDHIIKFHPFAFSLQNLELVPEVMSETRSPELRNFIEELIIYLGQSHLRDTEVSLFDYKFLHKTFHEIEYLCKIFEDESAAFNFTLDETFHVKLHLTGKIKELKSTYKDFVHGMPYIKSLSFLNEMLGNAQYYDQEFDDAIISYLDALQTLEEHLFTTGFNYEVLVSYILLKLKLGLTFEKIKDYHNALSIYNNTFIQIQEYVQTKGNYLPKTESALLITPDSANDTQRRTDRLNSGLEDLLQIIIQPLLAGLYLQEKMTGIYPKKIIESHTSISLLMGKVFKEKNRQNYLVEASFASGIGTLLFYKNASGDNDIKSLDPIITEFFDLTDYRNIAIKIEQRQDDSYRDYRTSANTYKYYKISLANLLKYNDETININMPLSKLLQRAEDLIGTFVSTGITHLDVHPLITAKHDKKYLRNVAVAIYKLADCLYTNIRTEGDGLKFSTSYFKYIGGWSFYTLEEATPADINTELFQKVMCMYYWSGQMLMRIGKNMACSFMFRKILQAFRLIVHPDTINAHLPLMKNYFLNQILQISSWNSDTTDRYQIKKYEYNFARNDNAPADLFAPKNDLDKYNMLSSSGSAEVREGLILFSELVLRSMRSVKYSYDYELADIAALTTPYNTVPSQFIRYHELRIRIELNKKTLEKELNAKKGAEDEIVRLDKFKNACRMVIQDKDNNLIAAGIEKIEKEYNLSYELAIPLVVNSLFCLHQIITIYVGYGLNYLMSYLSLGKYHERLGDWLICYEYFKLVHCNQIKAKPDLKLTNVETMLETMLGPDVVRTMDYLSEYQHALKHYSRAKQLHNQGAPYKQQTANMYFLEDDFNDSLYHFGIAVERQRINSGSLRRDIKRLQAIIKQNELYSYKYYVPGGINKLTIFGVAKKGRRCRFFPPMPLAYSYYYNDFTKFIAKSLTDRSRS